MGGDGTVPRVSATPIETDDRQPPYQPMYSSETHGSLQIAEAVQTQLLGILTARPPVGFRGGRGVAVEADELLAVGEPLAVRALPDAAGADAAGVASSTSPPADRRRESSSPATPTRCTPASCHRCQPGDYRAAGRGGRRVGAARRPGARAGVRRRRRPARRRAVTT